MTSTTEEQAKALLGEVSRAGWKALDTISDHSRLWHDSWMSQMPCPIDWTRAPKLKPPISLMDVFEARIMYVHRDFTNPANGRGIFADLHQGAHALQSAAYALAKGWDDEIVTAAFIHDFGKFINRRRHTFFGAEMMRPYVSERVYALINDHYDVLIVPPEESAQPWLGGPDLHDLVWYDQYNYDERAERCDLDGIAERIRSSPYYEDTLKVREADDNGRIPTLFPKVEKELTKILSRTFKLPKKGLGWDGSPAAPYWSVIIERCWMT